MKQAESRNQPGKRSEITSGQTFNHADCDNVNLEADGIFCDDPPDDSAVAIAIMIRKSLAKGPCYDNRVTEELWAGTCPGDVNPFLRSVSLCLNADEIVRLQCRHILR